MKDTQEESAALKHAPPSPDLPARKGVTAWEAEIGYDDDPPFVIVTLHHGLGKMTRFDLDPDDADSLADLLRITAAEAR